jgi:hypothetical protein
MQFTSTFLISQAGGMHLPDSAAVFEPWPLVIIEPLLCGAQHKNGYVAQFIMLRGAKSLPFLEKFPKARNITL